MGYEIRKQRLEVQQGDGLRLLGVGAGRSSVFGTADEREED